MEDRRLIVLEPGKSPVFQGEWTVGEVAAMAQGLAQWVNRIPLREVTPDAETLGSRDTDVKHRQQ
jgi:hypothetical protein